MDLLIREAVPDDAAKIVDIFNPIIDAGCFTIFDSPFTVAAERTFIENLHDRAVFHVAIQKHDNRMLGFQSMEPFATYADAFNHVAVLGTYVDLNCHKQGVAKLLFQATFEAARKKGYEKIFTYIRADNSAALATYQKQGFRIVGTAKRHAKLHGNYIDEIIVERLL